MTDAPNSILEFGRRKPHPRRTPPGSRPPQGKAPLCKGSCRGFAATEGLPEVAGHFGNDLCCDPHPFLLSAPQTLRCAPLARVIDGASPPFRRGRCPHRPATWHHDRPVGAGLCPRPLLPGLMGSPGEPWGPTHVSARTHFLSGPVHGRTHRSAPTRLPEAFRNQWESVQKTAPASAERREKRRLCRVLIRQ